MAALFGVERAKGCNGAPTVGQVAGVGVGKRDGGGAEIEGGACEDCRKISSKLGAVPVEEGGNMY